MRVLSVITVGVALASVDGAYSTTLVLDSFVVHTTIVDVAVVEEVESAEIIGALVSAEGTSDVVNIISVDVALFPLGSRDSTMKKYFVELERLVSAIECSLIRFISDIDCVLVAVARL